MVNSSAATWASPGSRSHLSEAQRQAENRDDALLVVGVTPSSPAAAAGVLVGDLLIDFDGHAIGSPEDLLDLLAGDRVGRALPLRILRGTSSTHGNRHRRQAS